MNILWRREWSAGGESSSIDGLGSIHSSCVFQKFTFSSRDNTNGDVDSNACAGCVFGLHVAIGLDDAIGRQAGM